MAATFPSLLFQTAVVLSLSSLTPTTSTPVYVVTPVGVLQGTQDTSPDGLPYYAFRGVPYAHPPTGERRWKLPEALPEFDAIYNATGFKPACPQAREGGLVTDEDCLYLDVYVPHGVGTTRVLDNATLAWEMWVEWQRNHTAPSALPGNEVPVMVWIHGGSFNSGSSGENEAWKVATEQEVVVVVIQYRLGALGFLSSGSSELPGNYALWDQRQALMWVKDNIRGFGGDASRVTAAGESAGSACVSQHTLTPRSAGLFHRAVLMSGTAEASWCFNYNPRATFDRFSKLAGCGNNVTSVPTRLQCLMTLPADVIYNFSTIAGAGNSLAFVPTVDGDLFPKPVWELLTDEDYLSSTGFYNYDFLVGTLNKEGVLIFNLMLLLVPSLPATGQFPYVALDRYFVDGILTQVLGPGFGPNVRDVAIQEYFYPRSPGEVSVDVGKVFDLYTDASFIVPATKTVRNHARGGSSSRSSTESSTSSTRSSNSSSTESGRSYMYFFDWVPSLTEGTMFEGMPHALDVDYLWGLTNDSLVLYGNLHLGGTILPREHVLSRKFGDMVGAFVRTGDPNNGIPDNVKGRWLPYDVINETFLRFSMTPTVDHHLHADRVSLWVDLVPRLQTRWQNQTTNQGSDNNKQPANESAACQEMTYFDLSEDEANALIIALIVVCGVLVLVCVFLVVKLCSGDGASSNRYSVDG